MLFFFFFHRRRVCSDEIAILVFIKDIDLIYAFHLDPFPTNNSQDEYIFLETRLYIFNAQYQKKGLVVSGLQ